MPPKKDVAAKGGVKGKAKAAVKEEKKAQKAAKTQGKGKLFTQYSYYITHIIYSLYVFILRFSELIKRVSEWDSLCKMITFWIYLNWWFFFIPPISTHPCTLTPSPFIAVKVEKLSKKAMKAKKNAGKPKKPMSAFFCYQKARREALKNEAP